MSKKFIKISREDIENNGFPKLDYHIHSDFVDGFCPIEDIITAAKQRRLLQIAITEHIWRGAEWIDEFLKKIHLVNKGEKYALVGAEAKVINRKGDIDFNLAYKDKFDIIVGCAHRYPTSNTDDYLDPNFISASEAIAIEEESLIAMIRRGNIDVIGHIGRILEKYFPDVKFPVNVLENIIMEAKKYDVMVEINTRSKNVLDVFEVCIRLDCFMSFGSDAHYLDAIGIYEEDRFIDKLNMIRLEENKVK